jgi:CcmD family protein
MNYYLFAAYSVVGLLGLELHLPRAMNYYLFAAYSLVWTALFIYILALHRKQRAMERKLEELSDGAARRG